MNKKNMFLMLVCIFSFCLMCVGYSNIVKELGVQGTAQAYYTHNGVVLDGSFNDSIWTSNVKQKYISHATEDGSIVMDIYATRTSNDVFFLVKYYTKSLKTSTSGTWSDYDCIDVRIVDNTNYWAFNLKEKANFNNSNYKHSFYISTMNGCTTNFSAAFVSNPYYNSVTGYYEINFEFVESYSDILKYTDKTSGDSSGNYVSTVNSSTLLASHFATHYQGSEVSTFNWGNGTYYNNYKLTTLGIELTGNLINNSIYESIGTWNSNLHKISLDGSMPWEIEYKFNNKGNNTNGTNYDYNFVADIYSPSWANGGWTIRSDWYGWGDWTFAATDAVYGDGFGSNATFNNPGENWVNNFASYSKDMDVVLNISFNPSNSYMLITITLHSNAVSTDDITYTYSCSNISWRGTMTVGLGANYADITINSLIVKNGRIIEKVDSHDRLAGKMVEIDSNSSNFQNIFYAYSNYSVALYKNKTLSSTGSYAVSISTKDNTSAGIIFGYSNYCCYRMYINKDKNLIVDKVTNGNVSTLASVAVPGYQVNTTYVYNIQLNSDGINCYFNNQLRTIVAAQVTSGLRVGVFGSRGAVFSNCSVTWFCFLLLSLVFCQAFFN